MLRVTHLYKYLKAKYAAAMLERGTVRIGTLYEYRNLEHGPAIGDEREGSSKTRQDFGEPVKVSDPKNRSWVVERLIGSPSKTQVFMEGISIVVEEEQTDLYLYCMTHQFSGRAMRAFGADSCVRIRDPKQFCMEIHEKLREKGTVGAATLAPCDYSGRDRNERIERLNPALIKGPEYAYQREVRLMLQPKSDTPLAPLIVSLPELSQYCEMKR